MDKLYKLEETVACRVVKDRLAAQQGWFKTHSDIAIFDIDGTLADPKHRLHWITDKKNQNWFEFFSGVGDDILIESTLKLAWDYFYAGCQIWCVSGRPVFAEENDDVVPVADITVSWLEKHHVPFSHLFMRKTKDFRSDEIVKPEIFTEQILPNISHLGQIVAVVDDRPRVIQAWKDLGLNVIDVGEGVDFWTGYNRICEYVLYPTLTKCTPKYIFRSAIY